jgi:predicted DNA-binding transcriptional regulator AlpA
MINRSPNLQTNHATTPLLNDIQVAQLLGISVASVRRFRLLGSGPRYLKISSAVRYRPEDLKAWLESRPAGGGHQAGQQ